MKSESVKFIAHARLKDIVGRELINDDNVAIIELIKNSKDAGSKTVHIDFGHHPSSSVSPSLIIRDKGKGMSLDDIKYKWLNIAYSEKKLPEKGKRYAGNKGIGRFSCDRLGKKLVLYTRVSGGKLLRLEIDWTRFEVDAPKKEIGKIRTVVEEIDTATFKKETGLRGLAKGTVLHVKDLHVSWTKDRLRKLRKELERFSIDPSGAFEVHLDTQRYKDEDSLNGVVENKIFETLDFRTSMIKAEVSSDGNFIETTLRHDGKNIFWLKEQNPYGNLSDVQLTIYFLNQPAKSLFNKRTGFRSVEFGSIFLFLNGFRVFPFGDEGE